MSKEVKFYHVVTDDWVAIYLESGRVVHEAHHDAEFIETINICKTIPDFNNAEIAHHHVFICGEESYEIADDLIRLSGEGITPELWKEIEGLDGVQ